MRQIKQIKIDDREVEVYELKVKHVRQIVDDLMNQSMTLPDVIDKWLDKATSLTRAEIEDLYPSEAEKLIEAFEAVNDPFLRACKRLKLDQYLAGVLKLMSAELTKAFAVSSSPDTRAHGTTDTVSS